MEKTEKEKQIASLQNHYQRYEKEYQQLTNTYIKNPTPENEMALTFHGKVICGNQNEIVKLIKQLKTDTTTA